MVDTHQRNLRPPIENERLTAWLNRTSDRLSPMFNASLPALMRVTAKYSKPLGVGSQVPPKLSGTLRVRVAAREEVAADGSVVSLLLTDLDDRPLPRWFPGAHLDVTLPSGLQRQYSLCGDPDDRNHYRIAVRLLSDGNGGSLEVHSLQVDDVLTVSHPRNAFPFAAVGHHDTGHRKIRFVAAGIGITPILPMAEAAARLGLNYSLLYLGRSLDSMAFLDRVRALGDRATIRTDDVEGVMPIRKVIGRTRPETALYICGPNALITAALDRLADAPRVEVHFERFTTPPIIDGHPFRVVLAKTGRDIDVAADQSMLDAILAVRPDTLHSCKQGFCGTCRLRVVDGSPDHRDTILTADERSRGMMLPCVSRAADEITVEL